MSLPASTIMLPRHGLLSALLAIDGIDVRERPERITPQQSPFSDRIKSLLGRGLLQPESLTPLEVQEMTASVVYFLISQRA